MCQWVHFLLSCHTIASAQRHSPEGYAKAQQIRRTGRTRRMERTEMSNSTLPQNLVSVEESVLPEWCKMKIIKIYMPSETDRRRRRRRQRSRIRFDFLPMELNAIRTCIILLLGNDFARTRARTHARTFRSHSADTYRYMQCYGTMIVDCHLETVIFMHAPLFHWKIVENHFSKWYGSVFSVVCVQCTREMFGVGLIHTHTLTHDASNGCELLFGVDVNEFESVMVVGVGVVVANCFRFE